jgi:hypothetical protein
VQAKATDHVERFLTLGGQTLSYPIDVSHFEQWDRFWEPVVVTLWDSATDTTFWETIQSTADPEKKSAARPMERRKTVQFRIPVKNKLDREGIERIKVRTRVRFERFEREKEDAEYLIEILNNTFGINIVYDPQSGVLMLPQGKFVEDPGAHRRMHLFGRAALQVQRIAELADATPERVLKQGLHVYKQVWEGFEGGGKLVIEDKDGNIVKKWNSMEEFDVDLQRGEETREMD